MTSCIYQVFKIRSKNCKTDCVGRRDQGTMPIVSFILSKTECYSRTLTESDTVNLAVAIIMDHGYDVSKKKECTVESFTFIKD